MRKVIKVSIPEPCHEGWENMSPENKGRFCKACEKTVHDFTNKTDEQIIKAFESDSKLCGRFKTNQLDRKMVLARKSKNNYRTIAASGLFAFLALHSFKSEAQEGKILPQTEHLKPVNHIKGKVAASVLNERVISGTVLDENNLPLPGANIVIKNTNIGATTDFDGHFYLKVKQGNVLQVSYLGYETKEISILNENKLSLSLTLDVEIMGEMIITDCYNMDYEYIPTPEEQAEERRKYQFRLANNKAFYKRKRKEDREAKKLKRQQKRNQK